MKLAKRAKNGSGKSVVIPMRIWHDAKVPEVCIIAEDGTIFSSISSDPKSVRGNPHLYKQLVDALRKAGAPAPREDREEEVQDKTVVLRSTRYAPKGKPAANSQK